MLRYPFLTDYMLNRDWDCHANECAHQATHAAASAKRSALSSSSGITTQSKNMSFPMFSTEFGFRFVFGI